MDPRLRGDDNFAFSINLREMSFPRRRETMPFSRNSSIYDLVKQYVANAKHSHTKFNNRTSAQDPRSRVKSAECGLYSPSPKPACIQFVRQFRIAYLSASML